MTSILSRWIFVLSFILASGSAFAEEAKVEITSFSFAGSRTRAAELCGKVTGISSSVIVKVTVDEKTDRPGVYNVFVDKDGAFCTTVVTYRGTAIAGISGAAQGLASATLSSTEESR